jgi:hypothetical protein
MVTKAEINRMWTGYRQRIAELGAHTVLKSGFIDKGQLEMLRERLALRADAGIAVRNAERGKRQLESEWDSVLSRIHG